jgi:hypothetical protein
MDRIRTILQFQWRAYWRRFHGSGNLRSSNLGPMILFGVLAFVRYLQQLPLVAAQMAKGETAKYQTLLLVVFLASAFAVMAETRRSITSRKLLHLPLSTAELFLIRLGSVFCSPMSWIVMAASLTLSYTIVVARHPVAGMIALLLFLVFSLFTGLTITHLLNSSLVRRLLLVVVFAVSVIGALLWLGKRTELLASLRWLSPGYLTAAAAVSQSPLRLLAVLAVITAIAGWLALKTFTLTLQPRQDRRASGFMLFGSLQFPGRFGGLLKKDLRYTTRLLDIYLTLPIVIFFNMYLTSDPVPSVVVLAIIVGFLFLPFAGIAFNCFGLESPSGLDRYILFPLSEKEKLLSKNLSFATLMMGLFLLILPLTIWKLGVWTSVLALLELIRLRCSSIVLRRAARRLMP